MNVASLPASSSTTALPSLVKSPAKSTVNAGTAPAVSKVSFADELFEFMGETEEPAVGTSDPADLLPANSKAAGVGGEQFKSPLPGAQLATSILSKVVPQAAINLGKQPVTANKLPAAVQAVGDEHSTRTQPSADGAKIARKSAAKPLTEAIEANTGLDAGKLSEIALQGEVPQNSLPTHVAPQATAPESSTNTKIDEVEPVASSTPIAPAAPVATGDLAFAVRVKPGSENVNQPVESEPSKQLAGEPLLAQASAGDDQAPEPSTTESTTGERAAIGSSALAHTTASAPNHVVEEQHKQQSEGQPQSHGEGSTESHVALNTNGVSSSKETAGAKSSDFGEELGKVSSEPVKSAHVQLGSDGSKVDIRLVERAGSLSVSVRSTDATLTKALSDHTGELTSRLAADHYKADLWTASNPGKSNPERNGSSSSGGERQGGSADGGSSKRQNSQGNSKQNQDPEWVQEFESIPGTFQKRIDYTWPQ